MQKEDARAKILIVDDDIGARESLEHLLLDYYDVVVCKSFDEASKSLENDDFDLAVIDVRLTHTDSFNVDGLRVLQEFIQKKTKTLTIVITAYQDGLRTNIFDRIKPDLVLTKGKWFDPKEFKERIAELLQTRK
ncbi:MAG TPA: response regulator [Candidatus Hydrogenedentes bacterium]|nr:response regulator [Candidatus Hydrogenedentota bacterium]